MKKLLLISIVFLLLTSESYGAPVKLDFTSGIYNAANNLYEEDGFTVTASHGFHTVRLDTLAWYESDNIITVSSDGGLFDLDNLRLANTAFAGLIFESSKGGYASFGSVSGLLSFYGDEWDGLEYFTVTTMIKFDILNQIDDVNLSTVPLPSSLFLLFSSVVSLFLLKKRVP